MSIYKTEFMEKFVLARAAATDRNFSVIEAVSQAEMAYDLIIEHVKPQSDNK